MALTDVLSSGPLDSSAAARGNSGVLVDQLAGVTNVSSLFIDLPAEGDVESGVGYGHQGNEFAGNVTLPAEADVRSGTTYGANGTEFTGSMSGGGGIGGGYVRRR